MESVLGFDTSTPVLSAAVLSSGEVVAEVEVEADASGRPRHARDLLGSIESVIAEAGGWPAIGLVGVGTGPGTFTGLRIGIATARAIAQARGLPLAGVSSLAALAAGAPKAPALAAIDAKRKEVFAALYGPGGAALWEPLVCQPDELCDRVRSLPRSPFAVGDGAVRFRVELEGAGARIPGDEDPIHRVRARHICRLATEAEAAPYERVVPTYLRRPDAELWRERDRRSESAS